MRHVNVHHDNFLPIHLIKMFISASQQIANIIVVLFISVYFSVLDWSVTAFFGHPFAPFSSFKIKQKRTLHWNLCRTNSYLLPDKNRNSKQKTPVAKRSVNPIWNYTFAYDDVSLNELSERALELTIWDHDRLASNEFLGGVRFSLGTGKL